VDDRSIGMITYKSINHKKEAELPTFSLAPQEQQQQRRLPPRTKRVEMKQQSTTSQSTNNESDLYIVNTLYDHFWQ
jgi:hypothetical protein